jgi:hypothetical protein
MALEYSRKNRLADIFCCKRANYREHLEYRKELLEGLEGAQCVKDEETSVSD